MLPIFHSTFRAILSQQLSFKDRFKQEEEEEVFFVESTPEAIASHEMVFKIPNLKSKARERWARDLARAALIFIMYHELAHIYNGHTTWVAQELKQNSIMEVELPQKSEEAALIRQTLEYDADIWAANQLMNAVWQPMIDTTVVPHQWNIEGSNIGLLEGLEFIATVLRIVHIYFSSRLHKESNQYANHPTGAVREAYLGSLVLTVLHRKMGLNDRQIERQAAGFSNAAAASFYNIFGQKIPTEIYSETVDVIDTYRDCWNAIKADVEKHRRGGLAFSIQNND